MKSPYDPCVRISEKTLKPVHPAVNCTQGTKAPVDGECKTCPWNPAEQKRRLETGTFTRNKWGLLELHFKGAKA